MRLVRTCGVVAAISLLALAAGSTSSADQAAPSQNPYAPTPTPFPPNAPPPGGNHGGSVGSGGLALGLELTARGSNTRAGIKTRITLNASGTVMLRAFKGSARVGKRRLRLRSAGTRQTRLRLNTHRLGTKRPVRIKVRAVAKSPSGGRSRTRASVVLTR